MTLTLLLRRLTARGRGHWISTVTGIALCGAHETDWRVLAGQAIGAPVHPQSGRCKKCERLKSGSSSGR